jgi:deazaflavin-dependent oxidoreductase (nitroreductase family)
MNARQRKRRRATALGKYLFNPPLRALFALGLPPPGTAILETTGRRSGQPRRTPVTDGRDGDVFWIVAEHGRSAAYVRNIAADPRVRIKVGGRWHEGTARPVPDEDPRARLEVLRRNRRTWLNARTIEQLGTDLLTLRVDLADGDPSGGLLERGDADG